MAGVVPNRMSALRSGRASSRQLWSSCIHKRSRGAHRFLARAQRPRNHVRD
jgi:hypothetical protein